MTKEHFESYLGGVIMNKREMRVSKVVLYFLMILGLLMVTSPFYSALGGDKLSAKLYTQVMEKLKFEPSVDASNITIAIKEDGIVVLGGKVKSYTEKYLAEKAVEKIESVKGIANEIEVELISGYKREDADIVKAALDALKWTLFVPHKHIKVTVEHGHLAVDGNVSFHFQKERIEKVVRDLYGVISVTNNIQVKSSVSSSEVKEKIAREFQRNARIDASHIQVEVDGSEVILKGKVKNFDEKEEAKAAVWSIPGITSVVDQLEVSW